MRNKGKLVFFDGQKALFLLLDPVVSILLALAAGAVMIWALGIDAGLAYRALWQGAFGDANALANTLLYAVPLMFMAFAFAVAYRAGVFNLGAEGQMYIGAVLAAWAGYAVTGLGHTAHIVLVLLAGAVGGGLWGAAPAVLKAKRGVNEVITCIMLNYIAINVTNYLVNTRGPLRGGSTLPATPVIQDTARLSKLIAGTRLSSGILIAVFCGMALYIFMWKTRAGYKLRAAGLNAQAAECGGIPTTRCAVTTMIIAGALAGMGGAIEIAGVHSRFYAEFSSGYGFEGIAVSMLGANHPFGILLSAVLFGALKNGASAMQIQAGANAELVKVLQALVIFFIACRWSIAKLLAYKWGAAGKDGGGEAREEDG